MRKKESETNQEDKNEEFKLRTMGFCGLPAWGNSYSFSPA